MPLNPPLDDTYFALGNFIFYTGRPRSTMQTN
jgi:hypothetical protein